MSVEPPGGNGTIIVTGFDGQAWASATEAAQPKARVANRRFMESPIESTPARASVRRGVRRIRRNDEHRLDARAQGGGAMKGWQRGYLVGRSIAQGGFRMIFLRDANGTGSMVTLPDNVVN